MPFISSYFPSGKNGILPNREIRMILTRIKKVRQMGSIHPTDFIIYDFNKKRLQFERLFQRPRHKHPLFSYRILSNTDYFQGISQNNHV